MDFSARTTTHVAERVSAAVPDVDYSSNAPELAAENTVPVSGAPHHMDASDVLLPDGWRIAQDPATDMFYFYNTTTGVVQCEPPDAAAATAVPAASRPASPTAGRVTMLAIAFD